MDGGRMIFVFYFVVIYDSLNYLWVCGQYLAITKNHQKAATTIGNNVSIGHNAIVHGCTIHDNVLIGMGAIVMDNCVVESNSIVAAGAILLEGTHVPSGSIFAGIPAKKVKDISQAHIEGEIQRIANNYTLYSSWFK